MSRTSCAEGTSIFPNGVNRGSLNEIAQKIENIPDDYKGYKALDGFDAIKWALIDNNSTTGSGGLGLSLLKELILISKGRLEIVSNDGYYKIDNGMESKETLNNTFEGTIINIGLSTDNEKYFYL